VPDPDFWQQRVIDAFLGCTRRHFGLSATSPTPVRLPAPGRRQDRQRTGRAPTNFSMEERQ